jgi:sphingolipid 8-(E)-desaturase
MAPPELGVQSDAYVRRSSNSGSKDFSTATKHMVYTKSEIDDAVESGMKLIIFKDKVYNVINFIGSHPGGELTMTHLIGHDATDHMVAFHPKHVFEDMLPRMEVGQYKAPKKSAKDERVHKAFQKLVKTIEEEGYHETNTTFFNLLLLRYAIVWLSAIASVLYLPKWWNAIIGGLLMANTWQQVAFFVHDACHSGISHVRHNDYVLATFLASTFGGLSCGWWKDSHNVHHIITNHPEHDPDIQHLPVLAPSPAFFNNLYSTYHKRILPFDAVAKALVPYQYIGFWLGNLFGRFVLYGFSWEFLFKNKPEARPYRMMEISGILVYFSWYCSLVSTFNDWQVGLTFVLVSHLFASILHLQIQISHVSMNMDSIDCNEHFAVKALRTTMDVDCPEWLDWFHGGLQFQVIHHLFPRIPRHNLRKIKPLVKQFAEEAGEIYETHTFTECSSITHHSMVEVAQQCVFLLKHGGEKIHY